MDREKTEQALNADAVREILLRLPAKSVCRFRCVSKLWLSLLSDPSFLRAHAAAAPAETSGFYMYDEYQHQAEFCPLNRCPDPTLSFPDYKGALVDSCNGLILFHLPKKFESDPLLSICNPTTREHELIHSPPDIRLVAMWESLHLAFDPRRSPHYMIFASASTFRIEDHPIYKYSSETRSWKLLEVKARSRIYNHRSVYWNGFIVWLVESNTSVMLAALDVEGEQIRSLSLPPPLKMETVLRLGASGDRLHCIRGENPIRFEILEMSSMSSGWNVLHIVDLYSIRSPCDQSIPFLSFLLGFIRGDEDQLLLQIRCSQIQDTMVSCHLQQKIFTTIRQIQPGMTYTIFPLAPSLFPIGTPKN